MRSRLSPPPRFQERILISLSSCSAGGNASPGWRAQLQIERRRLRELLLLAGESGEAVGEDVGDSEVHGVSRQGHTRSSFTSNTNSRVELRTGKLNRTPTVVTPVFAGTSSTV